MNENAAPAVNRLSLGLFGDLLWDHLPQVRPRIRDEIADRLQIAIDLEEAPETPDAFDYNRAPLTDLVQAIEQDRAPEGSLAALAGFLWAVLRYEGPGDDWMRGQAAVSVIEYMDTTAMLPKLLAGHPDLVAAVRSRWSDTWL